MKKKALMEYKLFQLLPLFAAPIIFAGMAYFIILFNAADTGYTYWIDDTWSEFIFLENISSGCNLLTAVVIVFSVIIAMIGFEEFAKRESIEFLRSLPYARGKIWRTSYFLGAGFITLLFIGLLVATFINYQMTLYHVNEAYLCFSDYEAIREMDSMGNAMILILYHWIICMCIYSMAVFARVIMQNLFSAILTFLGILTFPYVLSIAIEFIGANNSPAIIKGLINRLGIFSVVFPERTCHTEILYENVIEKVDIVYYFPELDIAIIWAGMAILFTVLAYFMAKSEQNSGKIGKNAIYENIFIFGAGIYVAMLIPAFGILEKMGKTKISILMIVVFVVTEIVLYRIFKAKGKYDYLNATQEGSEKR